MIEHINKLFAVIIIMSLFTYFARADYNLPLFVFAGILWDQKHPPQKVRIWYLMAFSIFVDLIWIIYWAILWSNFQSKQSGLQQFSLMVSVGVFVVKIVTVIILFLKEDDCYEALIELP